MLPPLFINSSAWKLAGDDESLHTPPHIIKPEFSYLRVYEMGIRIRSLSPFVIRSKCWLAPGRILGMLGRLVAGTFERAQFQKAEKKSGEATMEDVYN